MPFAPDENPLLSHSAAVWSELILLAGPPALLVLIRRRMSAALRARVTPEDVFQEALVHAWRDRDKCRWEGVAAFRRWLLAIIDHRLHDLADEASRKKRGGGEVPLSLDALTEAQGSSEPARYAGPVASTTPSRALADRELAASMENALDSLPDDLREVVRLRLFEDRTMEEVAAELGLGVSGARHRFRKGAELYERRLAGLLDGRESSPRGKP